VDRKTFYGLLKPDKEVPAGELIPQGGLEPGE
jgi:hypothetical protein